MLNKDNQRKFFLQKKRAVYIQGPVPNQRSAGQKLLNFPIDEGFLADLDRGVRRSGAASRSEFIRTALAEKLENLGLEVPPGVVNAPLRLGKGGRPRKYPAPGPSAAATILNEDGKPVSPRVAAAARKAMELGMVKMRNAKS